MTQGRVPTPRRFAPKVFLVRIWRREADTVNGQGVEKCNDCTQNPLRQVWASNRRSGLSALTLGRLPQKADDASHGPRRFGDNGFTSQKDRLKNHGRSVLLRRGRASQQEDQPDLSAIGSGSKAKPPPFSSSTLRFFRHGLLGSI